jgi:WD40-like Beta Propeller Repeat
VTDGPSIGFFWSPDGKSLLVLQPHQDGSGEVEMLIHDSNGARSLGSIAPQPSFVREVLQFFDQYAQSLQLWAPDSSAFTMVGAIDGQPGVWVISPAGYDPVRVSDGSWAVWSGN